MRQAFFTDLKTLFLVAGLLLSVIPGTAQTLTIAIEIGRLVAASPLLHQAHFGYNVTEVDSGVVLAAHDSSELFVPASNVKLYTTAYALSRLGSGFRFTTEVQTTGSWAPGQKTLANLQLVGGGDPDLSGRPLPYQAPLAAGVETEDKSLAVLQELVQKLARQGIEAVDGPVEGIATRYPFQLYPDGWNVDDTLYSYGAPVSSLTVNDSTATLVFEPTETDALAALRIEPAVSHFVLLNQVVTGPGPTKIQMARPFGGRELVLWGTIAEHAKPVQMEVGVDDPALFASEAMIEELREAGIAVRGEAQARYRPVYCDTQLGASPVSACDLPQGMVLTQHQSAPLNEIVQVVNKVSQNLHAEMLLQETALHDRSGTSPTQARAKFLQSIGVETNPQGLRIEDGSGLSRSDLVTPDATVRLLRAMWSSPCKEAWLASLPIGGVDGSLQHRLHGITGAERIHAKTGSLSKVNTLSGYVETRNHRWLAFSAMVDATVADDHEVRNFLDAFGALLVRH